MPVAAKLPVLRRADLRPYSAALVLEHTGKDLTTAAAKLVEFLTERASSTKRGGVLLTRGLEEVVTDATDRSDDATLVDAFSYSVTRPPSWLKKDSSIGWTETDYYLVTVIAQRNLIAVHADEAVRSAVRKWLRSTALPPFRLVPQRVMKEALIRGEVRSLSLKGIHQRTSLKPDSKSLGGMRLQDVLNPVDDGTYAAQSARSKLPDGLGLQGLTQPVGTTPRTSLFWSHQHVDFDDLLLTTAEALSLIEEALQHEGSESDALTGLAAETALLSQARNAYELTAPAPEELEGLGLIEPDDRSAAELLERAWLLVRGDPSEPSCDVAVGHDGIEAGVLRLRLRQVDGETIQTDIFFKRNPTDDLVARPIQQALARFSEHLRVYFASGHVLEGTTLYASSLEMPAFVFTSASFDGFCVDVEKPAGDIHADIGRGGDESLFSWAALRWNDGHLTCDDGSGEIADFVHLAPDGTLSLIHIKAAHSTSSDRLVSAACFEVVVSQAEKNAIFLDGERLLRRLSLNADRACWSGGIRVEDRSQLVAALQRRSKRSRTRVVIVQPHLRYPHVADVRASEASGQISEDAWRLRRLDALLHSARAKIAGFGADLDVLISDR